jgi:hypothetical protein
MSIKPAELHREIETARVRKWLEVPGPHPLGTDISHSSVTLVVASVARQTFVLASLSLAIAQSLSVARGTNRSVVLGHRTADFDVVVTIVSQIFVLFLVLTTLPLTATVL